MKRIVIADGHSTVRLGLRKLLESTDDMRVIDESDHGEETLCLVEETRPDLLIVGLNLKGETSGVEVCQETKTLPDSPKIMVYAAYNFAEQVAFCLLSKADSCVHKSVFCEELLHAVRRTAEGERVWLPHADATESQRPAPGTDALTVKEREILVLLLSGYSNPDMAEELYVTVPTIRTHVRSVLRKLGVGCRRELVRSRMSHAANF